MSLRIPIQTGLAPLAMLLLLTAARAEPAPPAAVQAAPLPLTVQPTAQEKPSAEAPASAQTLPAPASPKKSRELPPTVFARVSEDPVPTLAPSTFLDTMRMAERYRAIAEGGGWAALPADLTLKPGGRHPAVLGLRRRLAQTGDFTGPDSGADLYDAPLVAAVKLFQGRHGLPETGVVGRQTIAALNVPASTRQRQLAASAARLMGSTFPFGERYVTVNIPSAAVEAVERGAVARRYVAVVGKPDKATPAIETRITDINFNPTWTVPVSVIRNEIIPTMRKNPGYLAKNHIRMLGANGVEVDPVTIDWASERAVNYTLRQDAGFDNSLGQVRIDMPNRHAVYMHDTPAKSLFARDVRFHSHGCVRVGGVKELVAWLLLGTEGPNGAGSIWGPIEIETGIATGERRDIKLIKPVPVAFVYLTGYATPDGRAHFRDDIYGLDTPAPAPSAATDVSTTSAITPRAVVKPARPGQVPPVAPDSAAAARAAESNDARPALPRPAPRRPDRAPESTRPASQKAAPPAAPKPVARQPVLLPPGLVGPGA